MIIPLAAHAETPAEVNKLLEAREYNEALAAVDKALASDPSSNQLKLQKGFILIKLRKLDDAEAFYTSLVTEQPDNPEPMNNLGVIFQLKREYQRAIDQLNATIQKFPTFGRAYENLGDTYIQMASDSYAAGQSRIKDDPMLISKSDLSLRFYNLARANRDAAVGRYQNRTAQNGGAESTPAQSDGQAGDQSDEQAAAAGDTAATEQEIAEFLRSWVVDWSGQDVDGYLTHYGEDFKPSDGRSFQDWSERKRLIINAASFINIRIESIEILEQDGDDITLEFMQSYESNTYESKAPKKLTLRRHDNDWKIIRES